MSKKIIAILSVATILFVCVFASCEKNGGLYPDSDDIGAVTDENGEFVLAEDGQFLVYVTDKHGEKVTDENGEFETEVRQFIPTIKKGVIEDFGFKLKIPDGWKVSDEGNIFERRSGETVEVRLVKELYDEYYERSDKFFGGIFAEGIKGSIKEDADIIEGAEEAFKVVYYTEELTYVSVTFTNNGNLYNVVYKASNDKADMEAINAFLENWEFKPYTYYPELTDVSETAEDTTGEDTTGEKTTGEKTTAVETTTK